MALTEATKIAIQKIFNDTIKILDTMTIDPNINVDEEALKYAEWLHTKATLRYGDVQEDGTYQESTYPNFPLVPWGIYWTYLGVNVGSEENKHRPVIMLRADKAADTCTVIPLSTQKLNDGLWYHVDLDNYDHSALVEQMRIISKKRIDKPLRAGGKIAEVEPANMKDIYIQITSRYASIPPFKKALIK